MASSSRQSHGYGDEFDSDDEKEYDHLDDGTPGKKIWSVQATEFYIRLLDKYKERLFSPEAQATHFTVKNGIWSDLTDEMVSAGFQLNQPQCRKKLENLKRGFNNCTPRKLVKFISLPNGNRKKVVSTSRSWPFYSQFLPIMNYIAANKVGLDRSVTLKRAAPILAAAQQELEAGSNGKVEEEEEVSENMPVIDSIFAYDHSSAGEFANGIENGHSEIKSIVASAFDTSDLGYGTGGVMSLSGIGGVQEYYQLQTLNTQPNTDGDIVVQVYDQNGLSVPVKMEPVESYQYEPITTTTTTELAPAQPVQVQVQPAQPVEPIIPTPITSTYLQTATVTPVPMPAPPVATPSTNPVMTVAGVGSCGANATRRLSSRPKKPTEKLRACGIISITSPSQMTKDNNPNPSTSLPASVAAAEAAAPTQNEVATNAANNGSTPVRQQHAPAQAAAVVVPSSGSNTSPNPSPGSTVNTNGLTSTAATSVPGMTTPASTPESSSVAVVDAVVSASGSPPPLVAATVAMRPELERVLVEELQGMRQEMRALNRNIEKMVDVHNRMNDTLERFLTALRIRLP